MGYGRRKRGLKSAQNHSRRPCAALTPVCEEAHRPTMFTSTSSSKAQGDASYAFTLAGLLKGAESEGYALAPAQIEGMRLGPKFAGLFPFQRSTVKWMVDVERGPGINAHFWETRAWGDGGQFWFFPLGGEFRLQEPPHATGGLLAEEMGLGKTIEVCAAALLNPRPAEQLTLAARPSLIPSLCTHFTRAGIEWRR